MTTATQAAPPPDTGRAVVTRGDRRWFDAAALALVAWGALAFGGVYPWAYWPLVIGAGVAAAVVHVSRGIGFFRRSDGILWTGCIVAVAVLLQVVPLPHTWLARVSPQTAAYLGSYDVAFGLSRAHPLSIHPASTLLALAIFAAFGLLAAAAYREFSDRGVMRFAGGLVVLGALMAAFGIVQKALVFSGKVYGVWTPYEGGNPFGPFVNRNHFAGWMLMAVTVSMGYTFALGGRQMRRRRLQLRERLLWLLSSNGSRLFLAATAVVLMSVAMVLTMSRSGILCLTVAFVLTAAFAGRRASTRAHRVVLTMLPLALLAVAWIWVGTDRILLRFAETDSAAYDQRRAGWETAARIAREFPLAGTGLNTFGTAALVYEPADSRVHFAEAHSDYLQLAAEGGLLVGVPVLALVLTFAGVVWRRQRETAGAEAYWLRAGATVGLVAVAAQEVADFSLQMPGNALLFALLCAIAVHRPPAERVRSNV